MKRMKRHVDQLNSGSPCFTDRIKPIVVGKALITVNIDRVYVNV